MVISFVLGLTLESQVSVGCRVCSKISVAHDHRRAAIIRAVCKTSDPVEGICRNRVVISQDCSLRLGTSRVILWICIRSFCLWNICMNQYFDTTLLNLCNNMPTTAANQTAPLGDARQPKIPIVASADPQNLGCMRYRVWHLTERRRWTGLHRPFFVSALVHVGERRIVSPIDCCRRYRGIVPLRLHMAHHRTDTSYLLQGVPRIRVCPNPTSDEMRLTGARWVHS